MIRSFKFYQTVCIIGSFTTIFLLGCSSNLISDKIPDNLYFLFNHNLTKDLEFDTSCNPFYIKLQQGHLREDRYILVAKSKANQQALLACNKNELTRLDEHQLHLLPKEKIAYIKECSRFPAGSGIPVSGGGAIIKGSKGTVLWIFYKYGWRVIHPA